MSEIAKLNLPSSDDARTQVLESLVLDIQEFLLEHFGHLRGLTLNVQMIHRDSPHQMGKRLRVYMIHASRGFFWGQLIHVVEEDSPGPGVRVSVQEDSSTRLGEYLGVLVLFAAILPIGSLLYLAIVGRIAWGFFAGSAALGGICIAPVFFGILLLLTWPLAHWAINRKLHRHTRATLAPLLKLLVARTWKRKGLLRG